MPAPTPPKAGGVLRGLLISSEVVLQALDVVFSEVGPALNFDEDEDLRSDVFDAVRGSCRDVDCRSGFDDRVAAVNGDSGGSDDNHPVFRSVLVFLVAEAFLRKDFDALDLVVGSSVENGEVSPRTFVTKHGARI